MLFNNPLAPFWHNFVGWAGITLILIFLWTKLQLRGLYRFVSYTNVMLFRFFRPFYIVPYTVKFAAHSRPWWKDKGAWEQCTSSINWEHAVCCDSRCSAHCKNNPVFIQHKELIWRLCNYNNAIISGVFCFRHCSKNCNVWEEWWNAGFNSISRYVLTQLHPTRYML